MSNDLRDYILSQLAQGHSIESITNELLNYGHNLEQIARATVPDKQMNLETKPKNYLVSFLGKLILWLLLLGIGFGLGIYLTLTEVILPYLPAELLVLKSEYSNQLTNSPTNQSTDSDANPSATDSALILPDAEFADCQNYFKYGYLDGFTDNQTFLEQTPDECITTYDLGYNQSVREFNQTQVDFSDADREEDLQTLVDLIYVYAEKENFPEAITTTPQEIGLDQGKLDLITPLFDLYTPAEGETRIFPYDPERGSLGSTKYFVYFDDQDRLVLETVSEADENVKIARVQ